LAGPQDEVLSRGEIPDPHGEERRRTARLEPCKAEQPVKRG